MKDRWVRFGRFLTGYNYGLLKGCSEIAHRAVKRYTAALIIICILWGFIGYSFVSKYLAGDWYYSIAGGCLFILIILQVERQIILADSNGNAKYWIRGFIAIVMAIIGSIVIDQIIFREDIKHKETFELNAQVDTLLPAKEAELKKQIAETDSAITGKEIERRNLVDELTRNPTIKMMSKQHSSTSIPVPINDSVPTPTPKAQTSNSTILTETSVPNPKSGMLEPLYQQIKDLRANKMAQEDRIIKLRNEVEQEAKANNGFLYELKIMYDILHESGPALIVWLLWFFLLLGIEIFIMVNKMAHVETDYDVTIQHHMELQKRKLKLLAMQIP